MVGAAGKKIIFFLGAISLGAWAEERGKVVRLQAGGDAQASAVTIAGDRPLSFPTMKRPDPPRVVIDFADADVAAEQRDLAVDDGIVRRVAIAPAGARTARVVIELQTDAEFDVRATQNDVEIRITRSTQASSAPAGTQTAAQAADPEPSEAQVIASLPRVSLVASTPAPAEPPSAKQPATATATQPATPIAKQPATPATPRAKLALASAHIIGIGFRPVQGGEVIVRSDHPLEYGVSGDEKAILLHLRSARIPVANNRRPLDTRFFDGPVERVEPLPVAGGTDLRIVLRAPAEYQLEQTGSVLTVTFSTPQ